MDDRELLELAAKAAGVEAYNGILWGYDGKQWNPLTDDGDAFRLADALGLTVNFATGDVRFVPDGLVEDICIRRAITRAAAAIAQEMTNAQG